MGVVWLKVGAGPGMLRKLMKIINPPCAPGGRQLKVAITCVVVLCGSHR